MKTTLTLIVLLLMVWGKVFGQSNYERILIEPDEKEYLNDSLKVKKTYKLDEYSFLIGNLIKDDYSKDYGLRMKVLNGEKVIFNSQGAADSYIFEPIFYKNSNSKVLLIFVESATEYTWGNSLFILEDEVCKYIGDINLGDNSTGHPKNIMEVAELIEDNDSVMIKFNSDKVVYDPGGKDEMIYKGSDISYLLKDRKLKLILN